MTPLARPVARPLGRVLAAAAAGWMVSSAPAQAAPPARPAVAMPYYNAEQALQGLYGPHLQPLSQDFVVEAQRLVDAAERHCAGQATLVDYRSQWQQTLVRWMALSSPELGPMVLRRSQRQIDFWPTRHSLMAQAIQREPRTLADMERVGTPAKGFPALQSLLWGVPPALPGRDLQLGAGSCSYAVLVAQGIAAEARTLQSDLATWASKDWSDTPEDTGAAFAEWVNQWLAGLERLRWAHIEKPIQSHRSHAIGNALKGNLVLFPRVTRDTNLADWRAQWHSLRRQARLAPDQYAQPPRGGQALVPIEALLMGKGHLALAQRWAQALDRVSARMDALTPASSQRELLALTAAMKAVTLMYQNEVAAALDVPLGFSEADGD